MRERIAVLKWALIFFIVAIVAGLLGVGGIAGAAMWVAKVLFFIAVALFLIFLGIGLTAARSLKGD